MKTLEQFTFEAKKNKTTVQKWIKDGLVNGASFKNNTYQISDLARPPYTRASSKNAASIRKGIVVGCKRRLSVNAKVFTNLAEYEFDVYVDQVIALGLLEKRIVDGVSYYYATPKAENLTETQIYQVVKGLAEATAGAMAEAATEKMLVVL